jgi:hypothetical protein
MRINRPLMTWCERSACLTEPRRPRLSGGEAPALFTRNGEELFPVRTDGRGSHEVISRRHVAHT